jgi:hypothetical protein
MLHSRIKSASAWLFIFWALVLVFPTACAGDEGVQELECTLGFPDTNADFTPFESGGHAEIVLGFQGFVFTRLLLRIPANYGSIPKMDVDLSIGVEQDEPFGGTQLGVDFERDENTQEWVSEEMYLYFSPAIVDTFKDKDAVITLNLNSPKYYGTTSMAVHLVDTDPCIHTGGVTFLCPEDE